MADIIQEDVVLNTENSQVGEENNAENTSEVEQKEVETEEEEEIDLDKVDVETRSKGGDEKIDYGEDIDPDDIKTIGTIVEKQTAAVKKQLQETQDRLEVDAFVQQKPEFTKYKPVILKYLQHPVYSNIPVKNIAAMVASGDLVKLGAKKEREAQAKADATKTGGDTVRKGEGSQVNWGKAPKNEVEALKRKILGQNL
jgi:hypothetical protein